MINIVDWLLAFYYAEAFMSTLSKKMVVLKKKINNIKKARHIYPSLKSVYLDGNLKDSYSIDENDKSYGIFMHSLILSNSDNVVKSTLTNLQKELTFKNAVTKYTLLKGFDSNLIENIAPNIKVPHTVYDGKFNSTIRLINDKLRLVLRGAPEELLKMCSYILMESKLVRLTRKLAKQANDSITKMLDKGLDVYAITIKDMVNMPEKPALTNMSNTMALVALVGIDSGIQRFNPSLNY